MGIGWKIDPRIFKVEPIENLFAPQGALYNTVLLLGRSSGWGFICKEGEGTCLRSAGVQAVPYGVIDTWG